MEKLAHTYMHTRTEARTGRSMKCMPPSKRQLESLTMRCTACWSHFCRQREAEEKEKEEEEREGTISLWHTRLGRHSYSSAPCTF